MLFSIVVPVYNTEQYLECCFNSILNQSFRDYELIIVDDGSTDTSPKICDQYAKMDDRIRVIHKENGGVSSARNCGIEAAEGTYIWFVDSDDTIALDSLQFLYEHTKELVDLVVFGSPLQEKCNVDSLDELFNEHYFKYHFGFAPWNKLYRSEIIKSNDMQFDIEENIGEDLLFNIMYYQKISNIQFLQTELYNYVVRENSAMTTIDNQRYIKQMRLFDKLRCMLANKITEETLLCLYFMHLVSGINQTSANGIKGKRNKIVYNYQKNYKWSRQAYNEGLNKFLENENASFFGKIRAHWIYGYWRYALKS